MSTPEQRKQERAARKSRCEALRTAPPEPYTPKGWQKAPRKYPSVMPLDIPDNLVNVFASAMGAIRPRGK